LVKYDDYPSQKDCRGTIANHVISDHLHLETDDHMGLRRLPMSKWCALREADE
jgi:hypothetical protein